MCVCVCVKSPLPPAQQIQNVLGSVAVCVPWAQACRLMLCSPSEPLFLFLPLSHCLSLSLFLFACPFLQCCVTDTHMHTRNKRPQLRQPHSACRILCPSPLIIGPAQLIISICLFDGKQYESHSFESVFIIFWDSVNVASAGGPNCLLIGKKYKNSSTV